MQNWIIDLLVDYQASADELIHCVHPVCDRAFGCSAQHRAGGRNIFAPAVTQLLMLRRPPARAQPGAFCQERSCSLRAVKRAVPLLQNKTKNMNTNENLISNGCPAIAPQPVNQVVKPVSSWLNRRNGKLFHYGNVPYPMQCNIVKHRSRQPPIGIRILPVILTSILNVNVWWFLYSTHVGASKGTIWCPLGRWIQFSAIPVKYFV